MAVSAKGAISAPAEGYRWRVRSRADARYIVRRKNGDRRGYTGRVSAQRDSSYPGSQRTAYRDSVRRFGKTLARKKRVAVLLDGDDGADRIQLPGVLFAFCRACIGHDRSASVCKGAASEVRSWLGFLCSTSYDPVEKSHAAVPYRSADVVSCSSDTFCCGAFFSKVLSRYIFVQRCGAAGTFAVHSLCVQLCVFSCGVHQCTDHFPGGVSGSAWDRRICPEPDLAGTDCGIRRGSCSQCCFQARYRNHGTGYRRIVWIADKLQQYDLYQRCHIV